MDIKHDRGARPTGPRRKSRCYSRPPPDGRPIMAKPPIIYDLMLLLATSAPEERRAKIRADVEATITSGGGRIERDDDWGVRPLAYEINHLTDAEYHLLQFSGPPP